MAYWFGLTKAVLDWVRGRQYISAHSVERLMQLLHKKKKKCSKATKRKALNVKATLL